MTIKIQKTVQRIRKKLRHVPSRTYTVAGVLLFAVVGTILLVSSNAATPAAKFEAEAGTKTGNAVAVSDTGASGGSAVKFSAASTGSCPTYRTIPVGPKPAWGCWPTPDTVGVPKNITLTPYTGTMVIQTAGTVIDSKVLNGELRILADNVTIKNSLINGSVRNDLQYFPGSSRSPTPPLMCPMTLLGVCKKATSWQSAS